MTTTEGITSITRYAGTNRQMVVDVTLSIKTARPWTRVSALVVDTCHDCVAFGINCTLWPAPRWRIYVI